MGSAIQEAFVAVQLTAHFYQSAMSTPKRSRVPNRRLLSRLSQLPKQFMAWLLRLIFISARFSRTRQAGFVLPTTVMLILVLTLTVGGLSVRSFSRVEQSIAYREQQLVDNFAAPAVDRAKSKLEYLFTKDKDIIDKRPPSSTDLVSALLRYSIPVVDGGDGLTWGAADQADNDPYTLPDETQLDINGDNNPDPAWSFTSGSETIVYSLLASHEARDASNNIITDLSSDLTADKADNLVTRNGPINTAETNAGCPITVLAGDGWQDAGGNLQKNFQVNVLSIANPNSPNRTVSAAEYQQVRTAPKGNKYGAWFRYDLEVFPGAAFRWNGAMHSESNFIASDNLQAYLISSPESCVFSADDSEVTISESEYDLDGDGSKETKFKGHLLAGASKDDGFGAGNVSFHKYDGFNPDPDPDVSDNDLDDNTHSVLEGPAGLTDVAVDPVLIFTEDITQNLTPAGGGSWNPDPARLNNLLAGSDRVKDFPDAARPFVDDGFRADNRYGPKPVYDGENSLLEKDGVLFPAGSEKKLGDPIVNHSALSSDNPAEQEYGLDGYWERRSLAQGLRVVVGQRLELGNQFAWKGQETDPNDNDPLYPPTTVANLAGTASGGATQKGPAEAKQQRSLRDNLSAVQGMVVYHYTQDNGELPYICAAATVHPGTEQSLSRSRTFGTYPKTGAVRSDFFTGDGTNGWEFNFDSKYTSPTDFGNKLASNRGLGRALRNLALFAGDPWGGAPSFPPVQGIAGDAVGTTLDPDDDFVHPYPYLSMWGDFSVLRRIMFDYDAATGSNTDKVTGAAAYNALSPADKSTLHSAACTLGMLADNIEKLKDSYAAIVADTAIADDIAAKLGAVTGATQASEWIAGLPAGYTYLEEAKVVALYRQILRDRGFGFGTAPGATCDAADFPGVTGAASIVNAFCSSAQEPAYPSLYYLFPLRAHNQDGSAVNNNSFVATYPAPLPDAGTAQTDEYLDEGSATSKYIFDSATPTNLRVNSNATYVVLDPGASPENLDFLALPARVDIDRFLQPLTKSVTAEADNRDELQRNTINVGGDVSIGGYFNTSGTLHQLAFLDKGMMDGRELLNTRVIDLDIDKLTKITTDTNTYFTDGTTQVAWIPEVDGIFYAVREDAVREDSIVRPRQATWATCKNFSNLVDNAQNCPMKVDNPTSANQLGTFDPPLADNLISPKPVDMYADPDRRPYGFRLINGAKLNRSADDKAAGVTFVSDNPAYIYGDFNLHQDALGNILEEFVDGGGATNQALGTDFATEGEAAAFNRFYGRTNLDTNFSRGGLDLWRPSEVFADAVGILSSNFRDGFIEDAYLFRTDNSKTIAVDVSSSYLNSDRPSIGTTKPATNWQREDREPQASMDATLPILFDRNGKAKQISGSPATFKLFPDDGFTGQHIGFNDPDIFEDRQKNQIPAAPTRVNALMIAGIVPLRSGQNYGGLHNFPRLLEYWSGQSLIISGGFFQLNFSTHSTAPFDQDAWEPGATPISTGTNNVKNAFYGAATRVWGYDVGFQYTSVSPIARRFVSFGRPRSEFYRELPLNDEYVSNLCQAEDSGGNPVLDSGAAGCQ